jgi:hypothetical protein
VRTTDVPQDDSILEGHQRACYAQDADGRWVVATSRGWEVERVANAHAVQQVEAAIASALADVRAGRASPLAYHMARFHMTESLLAAHVGWWRWRVRRHLRPHVFATLPEATLARYAAVFGIGVDDLKRTPG